MAGAEGLESSARGFGEDAFNEKTYLIIDDFKPFQR